MKVWITKWALAKGILQGTFCLEPDWQNWIRVDGFMCWFLPGEWHRTEAKAIAQAEAMRVRKIGALEKQIARLKALRFELKVNHAAQDA